MWWWFLLLVTLCHGLQSPCPRVLRFHREDAGGGVGVITVPAPRTRAEQPLVLRVELSVPAALTTKFSGTLQLQEGRRALLARLGAGDRRPVRYSLRLPAVTPLPSVTHIAFLGKTVCHAPGEPGSGGDAVTTTITLEHRVRPEPFKLFLQTDNQPPGNASNAEAEQERQDPIECGSPAHPSPLVAEGETAAPGEWPWLVAVFTATSLGLEFHCAGTLVSPRHVVTAAHCVHQRAADELLLAAGRHNVRKWTEPQAQTREVLRILVHPDYSALSMACDLAVLELAERVSYDRFVRPACVDWDGPSDLAGVVGLVGTVVGWGRDELGRRLTPEPRAARMPIVAQEACLRSQSDFIRFTSERTFCAGFKNGSGPCNGDSGSGLLLPERGRWTLRGVVSLSLLDEEHRTCDLYHYVVFTDIAKFREWLSSVVQSHGKPEQQSVGHMEPSVQNDDPPIWDSDPSPTNLK